LHSSKNIDVLPVHYKVQSRSSLSSLNSKRLQSQKDLNAHTLIRECVRRQRSYVVMSSGCEKTTCSIGLTESCRLRWARRTQRMHGHSELGRQHFLW